MIRSILQRLFASPTVVVTAERIRGSYSSGRKDSPGVWYKD
jgi:hypothetical protein